MGNRPWLTIILSLAVCFVCSAGMVLWQVNTDDEAMWTPYGSSVSKWAYKELSRQHKHIPHARKFWPRSSFAITVLQVTFPAILAFSCQFGRKLALLIFIAEHCFHFSANVITLLRLFVFWSWVMWQKLNCENSRHCITSLVWIAV